jgi:hypothetical protein
MGIQHLADLLLHELLTVVGRQANGEPIRLRGKGC